MTARTMRMRRILASVLLNAENNSSVINSAMKRVTTKPVTGTAEIVTKLRVKKRAANLSAYLKNLLH